MHGARQRRHLVGDRAELRPEHERLLEVVADDLLVLRRAVSVDSSRNEANCSCSPERVSFGSAAIGRVADEDVPEAVGVLAAEQLRIGEDDLLPQQPLERLGDGVACSASSVERRGPRPSRRCGRSPTPRWRTWRSPARAGRAAPRARPRSRAAATTWARSPTGSQRFPCNAIRPSSSEHPRRLLDEERVALGGLGDTRGDLRRDVVSEQVRDQRAGDRLQGASRARSPASPAGSSGTGTLGQVGPARSRRRGSGAAAELDQVLDRAAGR